MNLLICTQRFHISMLRVKLCVFLSGWGCVLFFYHPHNIYLIPIFEHMLSLNILYIINTNKKYRRTTCSHELDEYKTIGRSTDADIDNIHSNT